MSARTQFFAFFGGGVSLTILFSEWSIWTVGALALAIIMGLAASTFHGWIRANWFEQIVTVPIVFVVRIFHPDPAHDAYLHDRINRRAK